ncbi:MAG: cytochrome c [Acidobacteriia bacterium]|nr:cytochrome c [Terriglobia bacterium]
MRRLNILAATVAVSCSFLTGCQVRSPGSFETRLMQGTKRRITVGGRSDANPLASTNENIRAGQRNFASYCMVCHGLDGQTTGVPFADRMAPPVPPLNSASVQAYTDGQLHWIIENGVSPSGMPASKGIFREEETWQLVLYIRNLPPKGSLGEPQVYGGTGCSGANCAH